MHHNRLVGCAAVLAGTIALAGCARHAPHRQGPPALNVDVAAAQRRTIATYVTLDGQIAPLEDSTLSFQQSGPIANVYVNQGDRVSAGELLASIDDSTLRAQLAQAQATIAQMAAQARSSSLNVPITKTQTSSAVAAAKAALASAQLTYNQDRQLYAQGYVSTSALEQAHAQYVAAQTQYQTALGNQGTTQVQTSNVAAARAALQAAQANANTLRTEIGQTRLYAPFDGVVTARLADPGTMATPGTAVLKVSRVDPVWVNVNVPDNDLAYVHAGTPVRFTTGELSGRTFNGRVHTINAVPTQGTLSYQAQILEPNPGAVLRGGMLVSVVVPKERHRNAIVVPRAAIAQNDTGSSVYVVGPGNKALQVPVRVGLQTDTLSQVESPRVHAGTLVITTRPDALRSGSLVAYAGARGGHHR